MVVGGIDSNKKVHAFLTDTSGRQIVTHEGAYTKVHKFLNSSDATTAQTIWDPTNSTKFVLTDIIINTDTAGWVKILDQATVIIQLEMAANTTVTHAFVTPIESTAMNNILKVQHEAAGEINVTANGYEI